MKTKLQLLQEKLETAAGEYRAFADSLDEKRSAAKDEAAVKEIEDSFEEVRSGFASAKEALETEEAVVAAEKLADSKRSQYAGGVGGESRGGDTDQADELRAIVLEGDSRAVVEVTPDGWNPEQIKHKGVPALDPSSLMANVPQYPIPYRKQVYTLIRSAVSGYTNVAEGGAASFGTKDFEDINLIPLKAFALAKVTAEMIESHSDIIGLVRSHWSREASLDAENTVTKAFVDAPDCVIFTTATNEPTWQEIASMPRKLPQRTQYGTYIFDYSTFDYLDNLADDVKRPLMPLEGQIEKFKNKVFFQGQLEEYGTTGNVCAIYCHLLDCVEYAQSAFRVARSDDFLFDEDRSALRSTFYRVAGVSRPNLVVKLVCGPTPAP